MYLSIILLILSYYSAKQFLRWMKWRNSPLWQIPGTKRCWWLTGNFLSIAKEPFMQSHKAWWKEAGTDAPFIHYCMLFGKHSILVLDADLVRDVLYANYGKNPRFSKNLKVLISLLGARGLVTIEGEDWQRHRRIVHPAFQSTFVKDALNAIAPNVVKRFINCWELAGDQREIDVMTHFSNATLEIIGKSAFSHDFNGLDSLQKWAEEKDADTADQRKDEIKPMNDRLIVAMSKLFRFKPTRIILALCSMSFLDLERNKCKAVIKEAVSLIVAHAREKNDTSTVPLRHSSSPNDNDDKSKQHISLLQLLLKANDFNADGHNRKGLNEQEMQNEVMTFLLAGHETTATLSYFAMFVLCQHPDIQDKVLADIQRHASDLDVDEFTIDVIDKMEYLDAFLKEVLRMYPPAGLLVRHTTQTEVMKGQTIPAHTRVIIPVYLLHRHPKYWKEPDTFKPERWMEKGGTHPASHPCAYLPFSQGARNCIGSQFAMWEAKLLLAPIIREFHIRIAPSVKDQDFTLTQNITLKTKPLLRICAKKRRE